MAIDDKKPLGRILIKQKLVSEQQLDTVLREQEKSHGAATRPLASRLTDAGVIQEVDALRALSEQHGVPGIDLGQIAILLEHLELVPREMCDAHQILPVLVRGDRIFLAMANPKDKRVIDELEFVTGKKVYPYIALTTALSRAIAGSYDAKAQGESYYLGPRVPDETLKQLGLGSTQDAKKAPSERPPPVQPATPTVVVDDAMKKASAEAELSTGDFGNVGEEISTVSALPEELRNQQPTTGPHTVAGAKLIMIVDDEADIRKLLKRVFLEKGYRVVEADRGLLALRMVKQHVPDLLILDAMLPELHGFDIARRLKGSEKYGSIPIIMISAVYRGWRIAEDLKSSYGIEDYLEKPFRISDVVAAATRALSVERRAAEPPERDPESLSSDAEKALKSGIGAYKAGQIDRAIELLKGGTQIDPLAYRLHFHLALLYGKKGQVYDGISELEKAIELNPKHFPALKNLAVLYEKAGFKHRAVEMWERCIHTAPDAETRQQIKEHLVALL
jgi:DNA-binding response OmpR family regulator